MSVIGKVIWNPQNPTIGQSVKIDVCGPDGKPYDNNQLEYIGINGVAGSAQYLQFLSAGDQKVLVTAMSTDGKPEQSTITITVVAVKPSPPTLAIIADPANNALTQEQIAYLIWLQLMSASLLSRLASLTMNHII